MPTSEQHAGHTTPPSVQTVSRRARIRTLTEAFFAMYIVAMLTGYAIIKIFQSQFANRFDPYLTELPLSEFRAASLFWITYAQAPMYETMLGLIEATCVLLVFFRRTRPIGALLTLAVMSNVAAMNYYFDISAKFNAFSLVFAALVLVVLFAPTYTRWIASRGDTSVRFAFGERVSKIGLGIKTFIILVAVILTFVLLTTSIWPLSPSGNLYGKWVVEAVEGEAVGAHGVAPLATGSVVMFNKMNVLAIRSGELFHFGRYIERDSMSELDLWMYRVSTDERRRLPPPGRFDERARALATYPLGYQLSGTFEQLSGDQVALRFDVGGEPLQVLLRKAPAIAGHR
jgi:hypothetical protein